MIQRAAADELWLQVAEHDQGVDVAFRRMVESTREATDNFEAQALPEADGALVGADDEVELHRTKAPGFGVFKRMGAHSAGDAAPGGPGGGDVAAIGNVAAA